LNFLFYIKQLETLIIIGLHS